MLFHKNISQDIFYLLNDKKQSLSIAESCTGGALSNEISKTPGASKIFLGALIAYTDKIKEKLLLVPNELLKKHGAVSEEVAHVMAENCRIIFASTWAISITGISGPSTEGSNEPLGTVFIGISCIEYTITRHFCFAQVSRQVHREKTVETALTLFRDSLRKNI